MALEAEVEVEGWRVREQGDGIRSERRDGMGWEGWTLVCSDM